MLMYIFIVLEKDFPRIKHSYDIWHSTKNLTKKLIAVSKSEREWSLYSILSECLHSRYLVILPTE